VVDAELSALLHKFNLGDLAKDLQGLDEDTKPSDEQEQGGGGAK